MRNILSEKVGAKDLKLDQEENMAVRLAKGNASLFLNKTPAFPAPEIDGDE